MPDNPAAPRQALTPEGMTMNDFPGSTPVERCRRLLSMVRHELTTLHGLAVTDTTFEVAWTLDETPLITEIDKLIGRLT